MQWSKDDQIPNTVIGVLGEAIGAMMSHSKINTLFFESGFPDFPPPGNCVEKSQTWLRRANADTDRPPLLALGEILGNLSVREPLESNPERWERITNAMHKVGLAFDGHAAVVKTTIGTAVPSASSFEAVSDGPSNNAAPATLQLSDRPTRPAINSQKSTDVFVIHGHDSGLKNTVARFLTVLGLRPIILHEQPDAGDTIIEKLEKFSDPAFAIALLTADDVGRAKSSASTDLAPRARQNVILEFGYFLGRLGRPNVCAIVDDGIDLPSDYDGVLFVQRTDWQRELLRRLTDSGFEFNQKQMTAALAIR